MKAERLCCYIYVMKNLNEASDRMMEQVVFALKHSMDLKRDGVDPMAPFAVVIKGSEKALKSFWGDTPDYADMMFEKTIAEEDSDIVVYASDSYITLTDIKYDAVLFKAYDKNDPEVYLIGQKFKPQTETQDFEEIGNPTHLGNILNPHFGTNTKKREVIIDDKKPWWKIW
jgi:hypothetical protein